MMKPLLVATAVVLCLAACAPAPPPGDSPVVVITDSPLRPAETATEAPVDPDALPDGAYLRVRATAHPRSGGTLDLVLTAYEPTLEAATPATAIDAISGGCSLYSENRDFLEAEAGVEHYFTVTELVATGDGVLPDDTLAALGVGMDAGAETGSSVFLGGDCNTDVRAAGRATLYNYFSTYGFADQQDALHWQYTGFHDRGGPEALNVTFDNCSVDYSDHARTIMGGDIDWKLRDEGWRCVVAPYEYE